MSSPVQSAVRKVAPDRRGTHQHDFGVTVFYDGGERLGKGLGHIFRKVVAVNIDRLVRAVVDQILREFLNALTQHHGDYFLPQCFGELPAFSDKLQGNFLQYVVPLFAIH